MAKKNDTLVYPSHPEPKWHVDFEDTPKVRYGKNLLDRMSGKNKATDSASEESSDMGPMDEG